MPEEIMPVFRLRGILFKTTTDAEGETKITFSIPLANLPEVACCSQQVNKILDIQITPVQEAAE